MLSVPLCREYEKAGFIEGIKAGISLKNGIKNQQPTKAQLLRNWALHIEMLMIA